MAYCWWCCTGNCTAIVLIVAIFVSGLRITSGAPTGEQEWWINPCNKQPQGRKYRSAAESQLKKFLFEINDTFLREITDLYKPIENIDFKGNCPRINNLLRPIKGAATHDLAMQTFYDTLVQFAIFTDKLKDTPVKTKGEFDVARRKRIFEEAKENIKLLICEFNDTLSRNQHPHRHHNIQRPPPRKLERRNRINMNCLPKSMDRTQANFIDIDFFRKLQKFLRGSKRILRKKKRRSGNRNVGKKNKRTKNVPLSQ